MSSSSIASCYLWPGGTQAALETEDEDFGEAPSYGTARPRRNRLLAEFAEHDRLRQLESRALERERTIAQKEISAEMSSQFDIHSVAAERQVRKLEDQCSWQAQRDLRHAQGAVPLPAGPRRTTKKIKNCLAHEKRDNIFFKLAPEKEQVKHICYDAATLKQDDRTRKELPFTDTCIENASSPVSRLAAARFVVPQLCRQLGAQQEQALAQIRHDRPRRPRRYEASGEADAGLGRTQADADDRQAAHALEVKRHKGQDSKIKNKSIVENSSMPSTLLVACCESAIYDEIAVARGDPDAGRLRSTQVEKSDMTDRNLAIGGKIASFDATSAFSNAINAVRDRGESTGTAKEQAIYVTAPHGIPHKGNFSCMKMHCFFAI